MPKFGNKLKRNEASERVPDVRHLLKPAEIDACKHSVTNDIRAALIDSNAFRNDHIDALLNSILIAPVVQDVFREGIPADRQTLLALHLGAAIEVGNSFASYIQPAKGAIAIKAVSLIFSRVQKRFRCLMLQELGRKADAAGKSAECRIAPCPETACDEAWDMEGRAFTLANVPILPLKSCRKTECNCSLSCDAALDLWTES